MVLEEVTWMLEECTSKAPKKSTLLNLLTGASSCPG